MSASKSKSHTSDELQRAAVLGGDGWLLRREAAGHRIEDWKIDCAWAVVNDGGAEIKTRDDAFGWIELNDASNIHSECRQALLLKSEWREIDWRWTRGRDANKHEVEFALTGTH